MTGARIPPFLLEKRDNSIMGAVARRAEGRRPLNTRKAIRLCKILVVICDAVYSGGTWGEMKVFKPRTGFADLDANAHIKIPVSCKVEGKGDNETHLVSISLSSTKYRGITISAMAGDYAKYPKVKFYDMKDLQANAEQTGADLVAWVNGLMLEMGQTRLP